MSRRRYLSTDISVDRAVNRLAVEYGDFAALLYTWMIPHALDDCSITSDAEELLMIVTPGRRDKSIQDVSDALAGMLRIGLVRVAPENPRRLIFPPNSFYRYQTYVKIEHRREDAPITDEQRATAENAEEHCAMPEKAVSVPIPVSVPVTKTRPIGLAATADAAPRRTVPAHADQFEAVVEVCYGKPLQELTKTERGRANEAAAQLDVVGASGAEIRARGSRWSAWFPDAVLTPQGLAGNWTRLAGKPSRGSPNGNGVYHEPIDRTPMDELARELKTGKFREQPRTYR